MDQLMQNFSTVSTSLKKETLTVKQLKEITQNLVTFSSQLAQTVGFISAKYDDILARQLAADEQVLSLKKENADLRVQLDEMKQYSYRENVEITGVPETDGENTVQIVMNMAQRFGVQIDEKDISTAHRVPTRTAAGNGKNIIARFVRRDKRSELIRAAKNQHKTNRPTLSTTRGNEAQIYINDHLTPKNKYLLSEAKKRCRDLNWRYVWVSDCKILVRKTASTRAIQIAREEDIAKIA